MSESRPLLILNLFKLATHAAKDSGKDTMEKLTLTAAFNKFFGKKAGQTMSEFSAEIKAAVTADRPGWVEMFKTAGAEIIESQPAPAAA